MLLTPPEITAIRARVDAEFDERRATTDRILRQCDAEDYLLRNAHRHDRISLITDTHATVITLAIIVATLAWIVLAN